HAPVAPQPMSWLVPYTTLFRSQVRAFRRPRDRRGSCGAGPLREVRNPGGPLTGDRFRELALSFPEAVESSHMDHPDFRVRKKILDRKSTRLNSSHVKISYAVFC